mmetsp:Transcript_27105/g.62849  ORF Transcript_27105/g.62849 Transcript_27105/m.62849 type:complete len:204 (-) Transcript_27105:413-1024(-)
MMPSGIGALPLQPLSSMSSPKSALVPPISYVQGLDESIPATPPPLDASERFLIVERGGACDMCRIAKGPGEQDPIGDGDSSPCPFRCASTLPPMSPAFVALFRLLPTCISSCKGATLMALRTRPACWAFRSSCLIRRLYLLQCKCGLLQTFFVQQHSIRQMGHLQPCAPSSVSLRCRLQQLPQNIWSHSPHATLEHRFGACSQ